MLIRSCRSCVGLTSSTVGPLTEAGCSRRARSRRSWRSPGVVLTLTSSPASHRSARGLLVTDLASNAPSSWYSLKVLEKAITCGEFETVMLEYSAFYREAEPLMALARARDVGIIVMRPLGGSGRTSSIRTQMKAAGQDVYLTPSMLLRYVLSNPDVSVAIPGVRYPDRVRENVALALDYEPMDEPEKRECERQAALLYGPNPTDSGR